MSLFQLKDWWSTHQGLGGEEFDQGSIAVGNVDNAARGRAKIVTGSFSGMLRICQPRNKEFSPADQLLEQQLAEGPILQVAIGRFAAGSTPSALAVLHPQHLVIYQVTRPGSDLDDDVPFLELQALQNHKLPHTAANMCYGAFGGEQGHDAILVQSFDGQVYIFEHSQLVQSTFLEDFLVPGPIAYVPSTDSIVTCSSAFELQSYTYASLVHAVGTKAGAGAAGSGLSRQKTPTAQWTVTIGELSVDIKLQPSRRSLHKASFDIVVVGEHTIIVCSDDGKLMAQRRLDYHPAAATAYRCALQAGADKHRQALSFGSASLSGTQVHSHSASRSNRHLCCHVQVAERDAQSLGRDTHLQLHHLQRQPRGLACKGLDGARSHSGGSD
jgi:Bardet-Biedl syndrome 9 protein